MMLAVLVAQKMKILHYILQVDLFANIFTIDLALLLISTNRSLKFSVELPEFPRILFLIGNQRIRGVIIGLIISALSIPAIGVIEHLDGVYACISFILLIEMASLS